ncbi:hypothetical protein EDB80DRAFT_842573 [Ilyonectria destructans]|nr:hypothetical protein EDB80DRAFT_842573 [Ilyonectria destructans]
MPFVFKLQAGAAKPPPMDDSGNAFGGGAKTPISAGFFRIEKGKPCVFMYEFDEAKFFAEGECVVEDETGRKVTVRAGDVMLFVKGSTISFSTETYALAFYCDQRAKL